MKSIPQREFQELVKTMCADRKVRISVTRESHEWFFTVYLGHYVQKPSAPFHEELFNLTNDDAWKLLCVVAFRGSGKSTLFTTSYALWSILGMQQKKFVLIFCQTRSQAKQHMMNLRRELENNALLKSDLGPFREEEDQVVSPEWISYYDYLPDDGFTSDFRFAATGVDLAISEKETADYTAMVSAKIFGRGSNLRIYILPNPVNERLNFPKTVERVKNVSRVLGNGTYTKLYIEDTGYQKSLIDHLKNESVPVEEFKTMGQDKRARLTLTTNLIQSRKVLFPRQGSDLLIRQLTGFGKERHDDLADAFSIVILKAMSADTQEFFPEWKKEKHVVKSIDIPVSWRKYRSISFGLNGYVCCHWFAVDYKGTVWIYKEYYESGRDHAKHAKAIAKLSETAEDVQEKYFLDLLDASAFDKQGVGENGFEIYSREGIYGTKSGEDPEMKWNSIRHYLALDKNGEAKLKVFDDCRHFIQTMPLLSPNPNNRKDVEKGTDTAAVDDVGYLLQVLRDEGSRPPENPIQRKMRGNGGNGMSGFDIDDF